MTKKFAGHKSVTTTERYAKNRDETLRRALDLRDEKLETVRWPVLAIGVVEKKVNGLSLRKDKAGGADREEVVGTAGMEPTFSKRLIRSQFLSSQPLIQ